MANASPCKRAWRRNIPNISGANQPIIINNEISHFKMTENTLYAHRVRIVITDAEIAIIKAAVIKYIVYLLPQKSFIIRPVPKLIPAQFHFLFLLFFPEFGSCGDKPFSSLGLFLWFVPRNPKFLLL